jgi:hypothetical protein
MFTSFVSTFLLSELIPIKKMSGQAKAFRFKSKIGLPILMDRNLEIDLMLSNCACALPFLYLMRSSHGLFYRRSAKDHLRHRQNGIFYPGEALDDSGFSLSSRENVRCLFRAN